MAVSSETVEAVPTTQLETSQWEAFAAAVSGEWDGVTVTFDRDGEAQELPEYYVPEAYRAWDVKLCDWQSQCSMQADPSAIKYTLRRLMPTVGCEADAIAFTEESQEPISLAHAAVLPQGAYSYAPLDITSKALHKANIEHCFPIDTKKRIRVVHRLKRMGVAQEWKLMSIEVHHERYDSEFSGRRELAGCGGGMDPLSSLARVDSDRVRGSWFASGMKRVSSGSHGNFEEENFDAQPRELNQHFVCLPLGVWSSAELSESNIELAAGVVLEDGAMLMAEQRIIDGKLKIAEILRLERSV